MDSASWPQGFHEDHHMNDKVVKPMDQEMGSNNKAMVERKTRPQEQLNCPRCNSTNTKFCYYNNYSLTQPRYFCKTCRRYWTEGGSLRNVPVGGGSRKNKRSVSSNVSSSSAPCSSISSKLIPDLNPPTQLSHHFSNSHQNPNKNNNAHLDQGGQDLNLAFPALQESPALELLRSGIASRGLNSFIPSPMPDTSTLFSSEFPLQEFKPSLGFSLDGIGTRYGSGHDHHEDHSANGRLFFPFGDHLKQLPTPTEVDQNKGGQQGSAASGSFWNGLLGGGSW